MGKSKSFSIALNKNDVRLIIQVILEENWAKFENISPFIKFLAKSSYRIVNF